MNLAIDASNVSAGGALNFLRESLERWDPDRHGVRSICVWAQPGIATRLPSRAGLQVITLPPALRSPALRLAWARTVWPRQVSAREFDVSLSPGATSGRPRDVPLVAMVRNLLPWQRDEIASLPVGGERFRLGALRTVQRGTIRAADGLVFLSEVSAEAVLSQVPRTSRTPRITIPNGADVMFLRSARPLPTESSFRVVYVSHVTPYKHQDVVVAALGMLRRRGFDVDLTLVGGEHPHNRAWLDRAVNDNAMQDHVHRTGLVAHRDLPKLLDEFDVFVFASSCESFGTALIEAAAARIPIACSALRPMTDLLGHGAAYFDPRDPASIADAIASILDDPTATRERVTVAAAHAARYDWATTIDAVFEFLGRFDPSRARTLTR